MAWSMTELGEADITHLDSNNRTAPARRRRRRAHATCAAAPCYRVHAAQGKGPPSFTRKPSDKAGRACRPVRWGRLCVTQAVHGTAIHRTAKLHHGDHGEGTETTEGN